MIVDDEEDVALTYQTFLEQAGFSVTPFFDPFSALKGFARDPHAFDLVVLDIRMQDMNGLQLYQSLRVMNEKCKFMFVTALEAAPELTSLLPGIRQTQIIKKPVHQAEFVIAVSSAIEH